VRGQPQIELVGEADDPHVSNAPFDVALWDVVSHTPQHTGFRFIALLRNSDSVRAWLDAGAAGIVLETSSVEELQRVFPNSLVRKYWLGMISIAVATK